MRSKNILWITLIGLLLATTLPVNIGMAADKPTLYVDPPLVTQLSGYFTVEIKIANVLASESVYGWECHLKFNPELLETVRRNVTRGPWLRDAVSPYEYTTLFAKEVNMFMGTVKVMEAVKPKMEPDPPYPPVGGTGEGTLATITFHIKGSGVSPLSFDYHILATVPGPTEIIHVAIDGVFDSRPFNVDPVANIAVKPVATEGELLTFDASSSTDDGWIVAYEWDLDYDGVTFDVDATGEKVFHSYAARGTYSTALRVTDNDGASDTASQDIQVLVWMDGGTFPDLVGKCAWAEKPKWYEATDGQLLPLNARIGNPTSDTYEVYAEFTIHSKDEGIKLGSIVTEPQDIAGGQILDVAAMLDLTDNTWTAFSGSPEWVSYGYYNAWGAGRKYVVFAKCYYYNVTVTDYEVGNVIKYFHFNVVPAYHDIGVDMWTSAETVNQGDILEIYANITNKGTLDETFVVDVTYKGAEAEGIIEQRPLTIAAGVTATETFLWDTDALPLGPYIIKVTLPVPTYEYPKDTTDQEDLTVVYIESQT